MSRPRILWGSALDLIRAALVDRNPAQVCVVVNDWLYAGELRLFGRDQPEPLPLDFIITELQVIPEVEKDGRWRFQMASISPRVGSGGRYDPDLWETELSDVERVIACLRPEKASESVPESAAEPGDDVAASAAADKKSSEAKPEKAARADTPVEPEAVPAPPDGLEREVWNEMKLNRPYKGERGYGRRLWERKFQDVREKHTIENYVSKHRKDLEVEKPTTTTNVSATEAPISQNSQLPTGSSKSPAGNKKRR